MHRSNHASVGHEPDIAAEMRRAAAADTSRLGTTAREATFGLRRPVEVHPLSPVHTARFSLRLLDLRDREEFLRVLEVSSHLDGYMPLRHPGERPEAAFARHLAMARNGDASGVAWRRIAVGSDGRIAGGFNLIHIERGLSFRADATWWVAGDMVGRGVASECAHAMLDMALAEPPTGLGLHEIHGHIQVDNAPCLRVAERVGMRLTGTPAQTLQVGDRWVLHRHVLKSVLDRA